MAGRYAIYFAPPPNSDLARFGAAWLGRDMIFGRAIEIEPIQGVSANRLEAITEAPRHYGFHATLKAPFALASGVDEAALRADLEIFAQAHAPFTTPPLRLGVLGGFIALLLTEPSAKLHALAARAVDHFDRYRRLAKEAELAQRRARGLSRRQEALLRRWGYPYVMEEFRFHMTLTQRLEEDERRRVLKGLRERAAAYLDKPLLVDAVALFHQSRRDRPFRLIQRALFSKARRAA